MSTETSSSTDYKYWTFISYSQSLGGQLREAVAYFRFLINATKLGSK